MIIKIEYYPDAKDKIDAEAQDSKYHTFTHDYLDAVLFIERLERANKAELDRETFNPTNSDGLPL